MFIILIGTRGIQRGSWRSLLYEHCIWLMVTITMICWREVFQQPVQVFVSVLFISVWQTIMKIILLKLLPSVSRALWSRYYVTFGKELVKIDHKLCKGYDDNTISRVMVWKWVKKYQEFCTDLHDESHSGCPSVIMEEIINAKQDKIWKDHRVKMSKLCEYFPQMSCGTLFEIVKNCLNYCKLWAIWVLKELTVEHLVKQFTSSLDLLTRYTNEGEDFLDRIVMCDEMWIRYINPENEQNLMQWKHWKNLKLCCLQKKFCVLVKMWCSVGVLLIEYFGYGSTEGWQISTVNSDVDF